MKAASEQGAGGREQGIDLSQPWSGHVAIGSVVPNPEQPRKYFDEVAMEQTAASLKKLQVQPIMVMPHADTKRPAVRWMIVDGERRWRALGKLKAETVLVCYRPGITAENLHETSFAANFCRQGHTNAETAAAIARERRAGKTFQEIGDMVGKSCVWAHDMFALTKLHPSLLALMDPPTPREERLGLKVALLLALLAPFDQLGQWERVKALPKKDAFHKLRTSAGCAKKSDRRPSDDANYLAGKAKIAITVVPKPMMNRLGEEHLGTVLTGLAQVRAELQLAVGRIEEGIKAARQQGTRGEAA